MKIGDKYKTYGGWDAEIIWQCRQQAYTTYIPYFIAAHKPRTNDERIVRHDGQGKAIASMTVDEPPFYDSPHPADLILEDK